MSGARSLSFLTGTLKRYRDLVFVAQRETDIVESIEQATAAKFVDLECG